MERLYRIRLCLAALFLTAGLLVSAASFAKPSLNLFVAASLADVVTEIAGVFEVETGISLTIVPAATSTLARQIAAGAPADVFLSADMEWVDWLVGRNFGKPGDIQVFAGNGLVVVAVLNSTAADSLPDVFDRANSSRIAIADPDHVPAGRYARQVLEADGRWRQIAGRIVPAANVRSALRYVETGQTDFGIVYATDAAAGTVRIVGQLADPDPPVRYVALPLGNRPEAQQFIRFLNGPAGTRIFCSHAFRLPQGRAC